MSGRSQPPGKGRRTADADGPLAPECHEDLMTKMCTSARLVSSESVGAADMREVIRSVLRQNGVHFTSIAVTSSPSSWKVIVYDETGMIFRLPVSAGPRRQVLQAVAAAIEAEW